MTKKRKPTALFEAMSRNRPEADRKFAVPHWMQGEEDDAEGQQQTEPAAERIERTPEPTAPPKKPIAEAHEPALSTGDGRLRLSLTPVAAMAALLGVVVLLFGSFYLGRATAGPEADVAAGGGQDASDREALKPPPREKGKWYLVIQALQGASDDDKDRAKHIVRWLRQHKIDGKPVFAEIRKIRTRGGGERLVLWSYRPVDAPSSPAAMEFAREIQKLGRKYLQENPGTYDFRQQRGGQFSPWYEQYGTRN